MKKLLGIILIILPFAIIGRDYLFQLGNFQNVMLFVFNFTKDILILAVCYVLFLYGLSFFYDCEKETNIELKEGDE